MRSRFAAALSPAVLALALGAGCATPQDPPTLQARAMLERFSDCDDLRSYVAASWVEMLVQSMYGGYWGPVEDDAEGDPADDGGGGDGPTSWSETNVQEAGVDEPDVVKTDGEFIYVAQRGELTIVRSWPAEDTAKVASLELEGNPYALFLRGDRALVYSYVYDLAEEGVGEDWAYGYGTRLTVVDVSDRTAPVALRTVDLEGWYASARSIGGDVYTVVTTYGELPYALWDVLWNGDLAWPEYDWEATEEEQEAVREEARALVRPLVQEAVDALSEEQLVPQVVDRAPGEPAEPAALLSCADLYHPEEQAVPSVLAVVHLDLDAGDAGSAVTATGVMADGWTMYASQESLYVAQSSWSWWWGWGDAELESRVHKFDLDGDATVYAASGAVPGWLLNQFSMGEHAGDLRVATTDWSWWEDDGDDAEPGSNVFVLRESAGELATIGEVRGIAPGEQIYSARFMGERGYLVTFEQIDPLFTLDLSNPSSPRVVGELEVPGYSSYLHPVGESHVLAVGMDGTEDGQITGFAVSLFDVSDFANPTLAARYAIESDDWSYSEALWDHHAFTFHDGVLTVPVYTWTYDDMGYGTGFSGLLVLDVDLEAGLTELGRIDHTDIVAESECLYGGYYGDDGVVVEGEEGEVGEDEGGGEGGGDEGEPDDEADPPPDDGGDEPAEDGCAESWYAWMRRGIVVDDALYSLSDYGLKVNELRAPEVELARVVFWPAAAE